jgi:SAM-dependent methyltransferase
MEYASFGNLLEKTRFCHLPQMTHAERALVPGDGDGRFLLKLLQANPHVCIDAVDFSPGMLQLEQHRAASVHGGMARVDWFCEDILRWQPRHEYSLIVTHFFLDCFSDNEVAALVQRLSAHLAPGGLWINSDFAIPAHGWYRPVCRAIVRLLYAAFYRLAGLKTQQLPDDASALAQAGLVLRDRRLLAGGLLKSELWSKPQEIL